MKVQDIDLPLIAALDRAILALNRVRQSCGDDCAGINDKNFDQFRLAVCDAIKAHSEFCVPKNVFFGTKQIILTPEWQSRPMLLRALSNGSREAVDWYRNVLSKNTVKVIHYAEVYGLKIEKPIKLSSDLTMIPLPLMEDTPRIIAMKRDYQFRLFSYGPTADIVTILSFPSVYDKVSIEKFDSKKSAVYEDVRTVLRRVMGAFTLIGAAPSVVRWWSDFVDPDLQFAENGVSTSGSIDDSAQNPRFFEEISQEQVVPISRILESSSEVKNYLDLPLERLNFAMRKRSPADKSIELGICLEAFLGNDLTTEINYRISLRAARFLESSKQERLNIRAIIKKIYDLRSKTVHGSRYTKRPDVIAQSHLVEEAIRICVRIAWTILDQQKLPDFDEIELGIESGDRVI